MGKTQLECQKCSENFRNNIKLQSCKISKRHLTKYPCELCKLIFHKSDSLKTHNYKIHNGPKPYQCLLCPNSYTTPCTLRHHINVQHATKKIKFKCDQCDKVFLRKHCLFNHRVGHHQTKRHKCQVCSMFFSTLACKRRHEETHNPVNKSIKCDVCQKLFVNIQGLKNHIKTIHETSKKITCVFCEKDFKRNGDLARHIQRHIYEKNHQCEICSKEFYSYHKKVMHSRIHTGERPFQCGECSESFTNGSNLKRHKITHEKVKPFQCVFCGEDFTARDLLRDHILRKIGERWYTCKICKKQCTTRDLLRAHGETHNDAQYKCGKCCAVFKRKGYIKQHMKWCE